METMTAHDAAQRFRPERTGPPRRALGGLVVAAVYLSMVVSAPFLVRYGPEPEVTAAVMRVQGEMTPRCAQAPEFGHSCAPQAPVTTVRGRFALFVP